MRSPDRNATDPSFAMLTPSNERSMSHCFSTAAVGHVGSTCLQRARRGGCRGECRRWYSHGLWLHAGPVHPSIL